MKKNLLYLGIAMSIFAAGCSSSSTDDPTPKPSKSVVTISATIPNEGFEWPDEAVVAVNAEESTPESVSEDGHTAQFSSKKFEAPATVVYPASLKSSLDEVTIPSRQNYMAEGYDTEAVVFTGYVPTFEATMDKSHLYGFTTMTTICGALSIPVVYEGNEEVDIERIDIVSNSEYDTFAGTWKMKVIGGESEEETPELSLVANETVNSIRLICEEPVRLSAEPTLFTVVIPEGQYVSGLDITMIDTNGNKFVFNTADDRATSPAFNITANEVTEIEAVPFVVIPKEPRTISATINTGLNWAATDQIVVNGILSKEAQLDAAGNVATFDVAENIAFPFEVFYPQDLYSSASTVRFYPEQNLVPDTPDMTAMAMVGYSKTTDVTMYNLCGYVVLPIKNACDEEVIKISGIKLNAVGGENLCGKYDLDYKHHKISQLDSNPELSLVIPEGANDIVLNPGDSINVYAVIPVTNISQLDVTVESSLETKVVSATNVAVKAGGTALVPEYRFADIKLEQLETPAHFSAFMKALGKGNISRFVNNDGEVVLGADINLDGQQFAQVENWIAKFNGNGHTLSNANLSIKEMAPDTYIKKTTFDYLDPSAYDEALVRIPQNFIEKVNEGASLANVYFTNTSFDKPVISELAGEANALQFSNDVFAGPAITKVSGTLSNTEITSCTIAKTCIDQVTSTGKLQTVNFTSEAEVAYSQSKAAVTINGLLVAKNAGVVDGCKVNAPYSFTGSISTGSFFSAVVGDNSGTVSNTSYEGTFTLNIVTFAGDSGLGAVVGRSTGYLESCTNNGTLDLTVTSSSTNYSGIAGVVGWAGVDGNAETTIVKNCVNNGKVSYRFTGAVKAMKYHGVAGVVGTTPTVQVKAPQLNNYNCGIIDGCTNNGEVFWEYVKGGSGGYANCGGVVGIVEASVINCVNKGKVAIAGSYDTAWTSCKIGGIGGTIIWDIKNCENYGQLAMDGGFAGGTANARNNGSNPSAYSCAGGIVGCGGPYNVSSVYELESATQVYNCKNFADLSIAPKMVNSGGPGFGYGGIAGSSTETVSNCINTGNLTMTSQMKGQTMGGIVGYACSNVKNCENKGNILHDLNKENYYVVATYTRCYTGGIVGYTYMTDQLVYKCKNSGTVKATNATPNMTAYSTSCLGGVVGNYNKAYIIQECENTGNVLSDCQSVIRIGGLAGSMNGLIKDSKATCEVSLVGAKYWDNPTYYDTYSTSAVGGLAGYTNANLEGNEFTGVVINKSDANTLAGLMSGFCGGAVTYKTEDPTMLRHYQGGKITGSLTTTEGVCTGILIGGRLMQQDATTKLYTVGTYLELGKTADAIKVDPATTVNTVAVQASDLSDKSKLIGIADENIELVLETDGIVLQ